MTTELIEKLRKTLTGGVSSEAEVVYALACVRKVVEQDGLSKQFPFLEFHCNWALHSSLKGTFAQKIIKEFDSIHDHLKAGGELPNNSEAFKISGMDQFEEELEIFLKRFNIRDFFRDRDNWIEFLHHYSLIISDCPLKLRADNPAAISEIVVTVDSTKAILKGHVFFKVTWTLKDIEGQSGSIFVLHSHPDATGS
ncbi:MAG: hypothetical protein EOP06_08520 [Proteobacteria bacterium]|nr:MAG: hypothetical protein EOP06_08520 [Pseudomonadota bacterium]